MSYTLSTDQAAALKVIGTWYRAPHKQFLTLGGYAGTGKTTLIAYLRKALREYDEDAKVAFCAYTGKATRVLQERLKDQKVPRKSDTVSTIHSLIYIAADSNGGPPIWELKESIDRNLIIVDEASMVDESIWKDLLSFKIPILAVGDHGQLPPIGSSFNLMAEPDIRLDRIFRQEEGSAIIDVATMARTNGLIPIDSFAPGVRKLDRDLPETGQVVQEMLESWRPEMLILCGYNTTRIKLNQAIRNIRDIDSQEPVSGDQVVCLRNNRTRHIYNGMIGQIISVRPAYLDNDNIWLEAEIALYGEDYTYSGYILRAQFGSNEAIKDVPLGPDGERGDLWDFGYALTVHKAQGSQASAVLLFEERFPRSSDEDWRRWLYTGITRAQDKLTIIGR